MPIQNDPSVWGPVSGVVLTVAIILGALVAVALLGVAVASLAALAGVAASVGRRVHQRAWLLVLLLGPLSASALLAQATEPGKAAVAQPRFTRLFGGDSIGISADPKASIDDDAVAVSPDGRWIAFEGEVGETGGVWVVPMAGGTPVRVSPASHDHSSQPVWFPDSRRLAFRSGSVDYGPFIYVVELDGATGRPAGPPRQATIQAQQQYGFAVSPDGKWIASMTAPRPGQRILRLIPSTGGSARTLWEGEVPAMWPAWSADGAGIFFVTGPREVRRVSVKGGPAEVVTRWKDGAIYGLSPDARYVTRRVPRAAGGPLWELATVEGAVVARFQLSEDMAPAGFWPGEPALIGAIRDVAAPLQLLPVDGGPGRQLTETRAHDLPLRWMPDGREVFLETQLDGETLYVLAQVDGSTMRQVPLPEPKWRNVSPAISGDGRYVFWATGDTGGTPLLKLLDLETGTVRTVTDSPCPPASGAQVSRVDPIWERGQFVYCREEGDRHDIVAETPDGDARVLYSYPASDPWPAIAVHGDRVAFVEGVATSDGSEQSRVLLGTAGDDRRQPLITLPGQIGARGSQGPVWSPDGSTLLVSYGGRPGDTGPDVDALVLRITPEGELDGPPTVLEMDGGPVFWWNPQWLPDGSAFVTSGMAPSLETGIWLVSLDPEVEPVELTADDRGPVWAFVLSPDGRRIAYASERPAGSSVWKVDLVSAKAGEP